MHAPNTPTARPRPNLISRWATLLAVATLLACGQTADPDHASRTFVAKAEGARLQIDVVGELSPDRTPLLVLHGAFMTGEAMAPFVDAFASTRPVIVFDQRGHGRTGEAPGGLTYERLADDAAAVMDAAGATRADVFGYSMGGSVALQLAIRHPHRVRRLVTVSAAARHDALYSEVRASIAQLHPSMLDHSWMRAHYDRLAPRPQDFSILVAELVELEQRQFDWTAAIQALDHPTMVIAGDYDIAAPEHAVELFRLRGGGDAATAAAGVLSQAPPARLLILPATSHQGIFARVPVVAAAITDFLDNAAPPQPLGFDSPAQRPHHSNDESNRQARRGQHDQ